MRNLDASPWIEAACASRNTCRNCERNPRNEFSLDVDLTQPKVEDSGAKIAHTEKMKGGKI